ncbi:MAG: MaoC/PaaZ C-terminal domain-containing protein [Actinomycetota bacterium]|nr:MaoC/PaaZ C-terminal domain-containing protein [Actinomycetota bacterium]
MEQHHRATRFFHDLNVGEEFVSRWYVASEDELIKFAREYDQQYFHTDPVSAKESPFGGLIASGTYTFALWNKLNLEVNGNIAWIAGMGFENFRFPNPLRPGVKFRSKSRLIDKRISSKDSSRGIVRHEYQVVSESNEIFFICVCPSLVHVNDGA